MTLKLKLNDLVADFAHQIAGIIREQTLEELLDLTAEGDVPKPRPVAKKPSTTKKKKKKKRARSKTTVPAPLSEPVVEKPIQVETTAPKPLPRLSQQKTTVPAFRRDEQERFEEAVLTFVKENPGADAGLASMRLGVPVARAQTVLDDFVMTGKMKMASGQHGRCYEVVEGT